MDTLPVYELVPVGWINESLVKRTTQAVTLAYATKGAPQTRTKCPKQYFMVLQHDELSCSGGGCPKHPMKESWMYNMENGFSRWGNPISLPSMAFVLTVPSPPAAKAKPVQKIEARRRR